MNELALFAGAGGGILGGHLLGWRTVCAVEFEPYAASVLAARQNDGLLPPFPVWDDVRTFDGTPWRGVVDVVSGGFPCQDISVAGKGAGIDGERSGLWEHMARIIGEVRPRFAFVENSPALVTRGLGRVLGDLAALGYDCRWTVLGAADVGAPHQRDRFWLVAGDADGNDERAQQGIPAAGNDASRVREAVAHADAGQRNGAPEEVCAGWDAADRCRCAVADANGMRELQPQGSERHERGRPCDCGADLGDASAPGLSAPGPQPLGAHGRHAGRVPAAASWWSTEPDVGRVANGVASRVDRLKAIGNGQVPLCAATAWQLLRAAA